MPSQVDPPEKAFETKFRMRKGAVPRAILPSVLSTEGIVRAPTSLILGHMGDAMRQGTHIVRRESPDEVLKKFFYPLKNLSNSVRLELSKYELKAYTDMVGINIKRSLNPQ